MLNRILGALCFGAFLMEFAYQERTAPFWLMLSGIYFQFASMQSDPRTIYMGEFKEYTECR